MEVLASIRWSHDPPLPAIPKAKVSNYQRLNWFLVLFAAWNSTVSEVTPRSAAGDCTDDKENEFPVKM